MAKLYYRYGAMGSSKTANALMVKYNYEERGQNVLLTKPAVDTRDGVHKIVSRCGLESECTLFEDIKEEEVKTICWCGKKATYNARLDEKGNVIKQGEQIVLGANDKYIGLCRKHWAQGKTHE